MKKTVSLILVLMILLGLGTIQVLADDTSTAPSNTTHFEKLTLEFVPSSDTDTILRSTKYLPAILKEEMASRGYYIDSISINIGESYEASAEALSSGKADLAWLPAGTYAAYSDKDITAMLTASRQGLSNDSTDASTWNGADNKTMFTDEKVSFYRGLILAGPSAYGKTLASKVANGEKITWEELDKATWAVQKTTSSAGYVFPSMWLMDNYEGLNIDDLSNVIPLNGYEKALSLAAEEKADIILVFADARMNYEELWTMPTDKTDNNNQSGFGRKAPIWDELQVIAVTDGVYNDTVSISKTSPFYETLVIKALQSSLIDIIDSSVGRSIFSIYSQSGYVPADDRNYDAAREALGVINHAAESDKISLPDSAEGKGESVDINEVLGK